MHSTLRARVPSNGSRQLALLNNPGAAGPNAALFEEPAETVYAHTDAYWLIYLSTVTDAYCPSEYMDTNTVRGPGD